MLGGALALLMWWGGQLWHYWWPGHLCSLRRGCQPEWGLRHRGQGHLLRRAGDKGHGGLCTAAPREDEAALIHCYGNLKATLPSQMERRFGDKFGCHACQHRSSSSRKSGTDTCSLASKGATYYLY